MSAPYTAARLHVMHTQLINAREYERLMKMSDAEIINFLQSTAYREDVDAYGTQDLRDLEIVDRILNRNHNRTTAKIGRIATEGFIAIANRALIAGDLWNLTIAAEAIAGGKETKDALERYGRKGRIPFERFSMTSFSALAAVAAKHFREFKNSPSTFTDFLRVVRSAVPPSTNPYLIDEQNILAIVRAKRQGTAIGKLMPGGTVSVALLRTAERRPDLALALETLRASRYRTALVSDPVELQERLHRMVIAKIRKATRHDPLSPALLEHYLAAKEIEQENLRLIIKGRRLNLTDEFIREHLVI